MWAASLIHRSLINSRLPTTALPMKEPPQMRYSSGSCLLTAQMSGELRATIMGRDQHCQSAKELMARLHPDAEKEMLLRV